MPVEHPENFPVASWLLPARMRQPVEAIYHFARAADDFADEGDFPDAERLAAVTSLFPPEAELLRRYSKGGKYLSLTVTEVMMSADDVVDRYDRASAIPGLIVL